MIYEGIAQSGNSWTNFTSSFHWPCLANIFHIFWILTNETIISIRGKDWALFYNLRVGKFFQVFRINITVILWGLLSLFILVGVFSPLSSFFSSLNLSLDILQYFFLNSNSLLDLLLFTFQHHSLGQHDQCDQQVWRSNCPCLVQFIFLSLIIVSCNPAVSMC